MNNLTGILGTTITILSFIYAIYENRRHAKLVNYNREQAWEIYRQTSNIIAIYQEFEEIKTTEFNIREHIIKGETFAQELMTNCIRMIKRFEKKFDSETIDRWYESKLLPNESHVEAFKRYILK